MRVLGGLVKRWQVDGIGISARMRVRETFT